MASAPVDFERETLREGLSRTPFEFRAPAFFAWLGVTPYLTAEALRKTLQDVAGNMTGGSEIVFDFAAPPTAEPQAIAARESFAARVEAAGEPLRTTFVPEDLSGQLRSLGFSDAEVVDSDRLNARYFAGRQDRLRLHGGQIMHARL